ncbi:MAG: diguanylate cyclase [Defluviitaleaceae bacterium]|nr:diguanylate cyclase [Defluviitaleaceae bacterium]MCL2262712.1 diguanylate cyclase [Defluviitaleaceae bacterium]
MEKKKATILVVDDSRISRSHLVRILQDDYLVHDAPGGVEAIQVAKAVVPDLILSDIVMPQMDGYEVLSRLREMRETKDIPVVFITSLDQEGDEAKGLELGAKDYITKPYNPTIVKLRIEVLLKMMEQVETIRELSLMDTVTKLPNRRYFEQRLTEEWQRAIEENRRLGILMIGVDTLRSFNTIYGYRCGDAMLAKMAEIVSNHALINPGDFAARWEYSGFIVLLQNVTDNECNTIGENIRKAVEDTTIVVSTEENTQVTISVGAVSASPADSEFNEQKFIANADSALYLAKELGRNKVVVHS